MALSYPEHKDLTHAIIGAAIDVHTELGPGLLESHYEDCLCILLMERNIAFERQFEIPIVFRTFYTGACYRADIVVSNTVIIEIKSVEKVIGVHKAQVLTYMKLSQTPIGLLINFNVERLVDGITRLSL